MRKIVDDGVTVGDYKLPKGSQPLVNISAIHRNPKYWINGYDAKRHSDVNMEEIHLEFWMENGVFLKKLQSDNFFTFHSGKRDCPGQALAMKEITIVLAIVFMKYKVEGANGSKVERVERKPGGFAFQPTVSSVSFQHRK